MLHILGTGKDNISMVGFKPKQFIWLTGELNKLTYSLTFHLFI